MNQCTENLRRRSARYLIVPVLIGVGAFLGCGTNFNDLAYNTLSASGQTLLDLLLTEAVNNILDGTQTDDNDNDNGGGDNGNDNSAPDNDNTGGGLDDLVGDVANGSELYAANCASCHCADATGGCLLDAPGVVGATATVLGEFVRGEASHPAKRDWTDQEVVDAEAYLASLAGE